MKSGFLKISFLALLISAGTTGCQTSSGEKVKLIQMTRADGDTANASTGNDYQKLRIAADLTFIKHDRSITVLRGKIKSEKSATRSVLQDQLDEFDQQNMHLKNGVHEYKESTEEAWGIFMQNYKNEMDDLDKSIAAFSDRYLSNN